jgi:seryl-tRNA synthetase
MIPIQLLRSNPDFVKQGLSKKYFNELTVVDDILSIDEERRQAQKKMDDLLALQNQAAKQIGGLMKEGKKEEAEAVKQQVAGWKADTEVLKQNLTDLELRQEGLLVRLPNLPHESVPVGRTAEENAIVYQVDQIPTLAEGAKPHWELTEQYKMIDFELGVKIAGAGFPVYMGQGARLQRALIQFFLDRATEAGYLEVQPPIVVNEASGFGTGQLPDKEGQMYHVTADDLYMIPTAEVPITNIYRDVMVKAEQLPIKMCGYTPCFRREAGSYGKDVRGLNRLHQFDKIEIVQIAHPSNSYERLQEMVAHVEGLLKDLELPYRILRLCGGDMSFASALTFDFEVWSAAQGRWLEVSSTSNFENFQANRLKCRYKDENGKSQLVHTLNGSALALPRIVAALLENHQTPDGIRIPKALVPYFGKDMIS